MKKPLPLLPLSASNRLRTTLIAGSLGLSSLAFVTPAQAEWQTRYALQAYAGLTFGEQGGFAWGLEGILDMANVRDTYECENEPDKLVGTVLRIGFVEDGLPRIMVAGRGGIYFADAAGSMAGEAGMVYRAGDAPAIGIHLGARSQVFPAGLAVSTALGLDEVTLAGTLGVGNQSTSCTNLMTDGRDIQDTAGRPLRSGDGVADLPALDVHPGQSTCGEAESAQAAAIWQERARTEWASVPAFTQLAEQLHVSNAPAELIARAYRAAQDEYHHAILTAGMSSYLSGAEIELGNPETSHRLPVRGEAGLIRLAVESWTDGCLGEGAAARIAKRESVQSRDPLVKRTLTEVAKDERAHAELAWDIMAWTLHEGGAKVARALDATRDAQSVASEEPTPEGLEALGCSSTGERLTLAHDERTQCLPRRDAMVKAAS